MIKQLMISYLNVPCFGHSLPSQGPPLSGNVRELTRKDALFDSIPSICSGWGRATWWLGYSTRFFCATLLAGRAAQRTITTAHFSSALCTSIISDYYQW